MASFNSNSFEDLNVTKEEIETFGNALKKEEFRKLLIEYVEEINNPENRKQYEKEIIQLEKERGVDTTFVHPKPGYVIKTSVNGEKKAFINVCQNENVGKPSSQPKIESNSFGSQLSIPYIQAPPRDDLDKNKNRCVVYDVVFHPDTLALGHKDIRIRNLINETALDAVEKSFKVSLDRKNLKFPNLQFKGMKQPTVIRKNCDNYADLPKSDILEIPNYPYPPISREKESNQNTSNTNEDLKEISTQYTIPKYQVKYRSHIDMQDFTNDMLCKQNAAIPREISIEIDLPLLKSATDMILDVKQKSMLLVSEKPKYKLEMNFQYSVVEDQGSAKFDKSKKKLFITLPVQQKNISLNFSDSSKEDSGVESDLGNSKPNDISSGDEDSSDSKPDDVCDLLNIVNKISINESYRTNNSSIFSPNIKYTLPSFEYNYHNDAIAFVFKIPNVDPQSVKHANMLNNSGISLTFLSLGTGFYPMHFGLCVKFPQGVSTKSVNVEVWDNNVIAQVKLIGCDNLSLDDVNFGPGEEELCYTLSESSTSKLNSIFKDEGKKSTTQPEVKFEVFEDTPEKVVIQITQDCNNQENSKHIANIPESQSVETNQSISEDVVAPLKPISNKVSKLRTVSESVTTSDGRPNRRQEYRGILKVRSLSESSADDYLAWSDKNTVKKTVRFSDVIKQQSFRSTSSILGQKKKNQRRAKNKKRAKERRLSESGGESEGENNELEAWKREVIQDISDTSSVSEVSDVSESDDGQKEELNKVVASSKKHKRRGKKSARKNAHTAKVQFSQNLSY